MLRQAILKRIGMLERPPEVISGDIFSKMYFLSRDYETAYNTVKSKFAVAEKKIPVVLTQSDY